MTHPTTEPNIRERLAQIAAKSYATEIGHNRPRPLWPEVVNAILAELQKPSEGIEGVMKAEWLEGANFSMCFAAAIQHIRDGGQ